MVFIFHIYYCVISFIQQFSAIILLRMHRNAIGDSFGLQPVKNQFNLKLGLFRLPLSVKGKHIQIAPGPLRFSMYATATTQFIFQNSPVSSYEPVSGGKSNVHMGRLVSGSVYQLCQISIFLFAILFSYSGTTTDYVLCFYVLCLSTRRWCLVKFQLMWGLYLCFCYQLSFIV